MTLTLLAAIQPNKIHLNNLFDILDNDTLLVQNWVGLENISLQTVKYNSIK